MVAQRYEWWWKFSIFITFSNNYPKIFLCFLAVLTDFNNFHEKKSLGCGCFLQKYSQKVAPNCKKTVSGSLSSMQQHLPNYVSANFMRKCFISTHNNIAYLQKGSQSSKSSLVNQDKIGWNFSTRYLENQTYLNKKNLEVFLVPKRY